MERLQLRAAAVLACAALSGWFAPADATDIDGIQPAALDQPRINLLIRRDPAGAPLDYEGTFNVEAFYDTGASGLLLSLDTAGMLGINQATWLNPATGAQEDVLFEDVGVAGSDQFNVSEPLYISFAKYHPDINMSDTDPDPAIYRHTIGPVRTQIGPLSGDPNPLMEGLDVIGVPAMKHKVVVIDPKPVNTFADTMRTYVYDPGTPYNAATKDSDPGIPTVSRHVKLSYGDFSRFTRVTPSGEPGPTMSSNPFIGWDPVAAMEGKPYDPNSGITVSYNGKTSTGTWLLDTGAAASIISKTQADRLGITYAEGTYGSDSPVLDGVPVDEQFTLTIGGIGGTTKMAGFYLDTLLLRTQEGVASNPDDPNHIRFLHAPVLVGDITLQNPDIASQRLTLDGIFGMNFLTASAFVTEGSGSLPLPIIGDMTMGRFDWVTFDHDNGILGLEPAQSTAVQGQVNWMGSFWDLLNGDPSDWDIDNNANFMVGFNLGTYKDGDYVVFDDNTLVSEVHIAEPVAPGSVLINNTDRDYVFTGEAIRGFTGVTKEGTGRVTFKNSNTYTGPTNVMAGEMVFAAPQDIGPVNVHSGGKLAMQTSQHFEELNVAGGFAVLTSGGGKALVVHNISVDQTGQLDLADNAAIVTATVATRDDVLNRVTEMIGRGRNSGATPWTGSGITSSTAASNTLTALGAILNDNGDGTPIYPSLNGEIADANSILIRYTWYGDANLDGRITADDYQLIDRGFREHLKGWYYGDFDYSGTIDADDYFLIDRSLRLQTGPLGLGNLLNASVPEPGFMGFAAVALLGLGRRRRRI